MGHWIKISGEYINLDNVQKIMKVNDKVRLDYNNENQMSNDTYEGELADKLLKYLESKNFVYKEIK